MSIGFPTNTVILIVAAMLAAGVGAWLCVVQGVRQTLAGALARRAWNWGVALALIILLLALIILLLARLALALRAPGEALLGPGISLAFLVGALLVGLIPLLISPTF